MELYDDRNWIELIILRPMSFALSHYLHWLGSTINNKVQDGEVWANFQSCGSDTHNVWYDETILLFPNHVNLMWNWLNCAIFAGIPSCSSFYPASIKSALKRNAVFLIAFTLLLYTAFGELVYLVQMLQREFTFLEITFQAPCLGYCSIGLMKMLILAVKRNSIAGLVQTLQKYWYTSVRYSAHN